MSNRQLPAIGWPINIRKGGWIALWRIYGKSPSEDRLECRTNIGRAGHLCLEKYLTMLFPMSREMKSRRICSPIRIMQPLWWFLPHAEGWWIRSAKVTVQDSIWKSGYTQSRDSLELVRSFEIQPKETTEVTYHLGLRDCWRNMPLKPLLTLLNKQALKNVSMWAGRPVQRKKCIQEATGVDVPFMRQMIYYFVIIRSNLGIVLMKQGVVVEVAINFSIYRRLRKNWMNHWKVNTFQKWLPIGFRLSHKPRLFAFYPGHD